MLTPTQPRLAPPAPATAEPFSALAPALLPSAAPPAERLLTKEQVCHELGISANTLTEWMKDGTVPFLRYGRRVYFEWYQLLAAGRAHAHRDQQSQ